MEPSTYKPLCIDRVSKGGSSEVPDPTLEFGPLRPSDYRGHYSVSDFDYYTKFLLYFGSRVGPPVDSTE